MSSLLRLSRYALAVCAGWLMLAVAPAHAQGGGPTAGNSTVGYIDSALPGDEFRLRYDAAYDNRRPTRAEFFWPKNRPAGPGPAQPETRVDYQDVAGYLELTAAPQLSGFVEIPERFLNPEVNSNASGLADLNAGVKWAFLTTDERVATFQLRVYAPTGDARQGLGNDHVSLEPALLVFQRLDERLTFEGELRYWAPVGGTDFAGDLVRYGVGLSYGLFHTESVQVRPIAELVGWTVLGGKVSVPHPAAPATVEDAAGQTILNAKLGVRWGFGDWGDLYTGYGRPLTGNRWYENTLRVEFRLLF